MGNLIGNYIHYYKSHYDEKGINPSRWGSSNKLKDFTSHKEILKSMIQSSLNQAQLDNLSKNYTNFFYGNPLDKNKTESKIRKGEELFLKELHSILMTKYSQKVQGFYDVKRLFNLTTSNKHYSENLSKNKTYVSVDVFNQLYEAIEKLAIEGVTSEHNNYQKILQNSKKIEETYKKFQKLKEQWLNSSPNMKNIDFNTNKAKDIGLRNLLQDAYDIVKLDSIAGHNNLAGVLGEESAMLLAQVTGSAILGNIKNIDKEIEKKLVNGVKKNDIKVTHTGLEESYTKPVKSAFNKSLKEKQGTYLLKAHQTSQNKADFEMILPSNKKVGVSVKNYSFKNKNTISLVDNTSIVTLMSNFPNPEFINHWLNLKTVSKDDKGDSLGSKYGNLKEQADETMKLGLIALAASGKIRGKANPADIIAINNRAGKQWKFISISNLINMPGIENLARFEGYPSGDIVQEWVGDKRNRNYKDAYSRINNILMKLHSNKLKVYLNVTKNSQKSGMSWLV